jgi:ketosteroid isomerase-like protein
MITAISPTDAVERVRLLDRQRIDATKANDVRALRDLIDDDLVYIGKAGAIYDKTGYLEAISTHDLTYSLDFEITECQHRIYPGTVMLIGMMFGHARLDGEQQVYHLRCMSVWRQRGEAWGMMGWQSSEFCPRPC